MERGKAGTLNATSAETVLCEIVVCSCETVCTHAHGRECVCDLPVILRVCMKASVCVHSRMQVCTCVCVFVCLSVFVFV